MSCRKKPGDYTCADREHAILLRCSAIRRWADGDLALLALAIDDLQRPEGDPDRVPLFRRIDHSRRGASPNTASA